MQLKDGVILYGLDIRMRPALIQAEKIYVKYGRIEGSTITSALDGVHSAGSLHYFGRAIDTRTYYFDDETIDKVVFELKNKLGTDFDVIKEKDHIHLEYDKK